MFLRITYLFLLICYYHRVINGLPAFGSSMLDIDAFPCHAEALKVCWV